MTMQPDDTKHGGLSARLTSVLPKDHQFRIYHLSTPPYKSDALYSAPPGERPDRTYCENHFLAVTISTTSIGHVKGVHAEEDSPKDVLVFGIEVFIYTTSHSSTLFVSKADSTGYLKLLNLPKGSPSPVRVISATFVEFLVETRRRDGIQFVINLFARAQGQYLFPGSVDHGEKHVLDDRGLVKWWCRVLGHIWDDDHKTSGEPDATGYLIVPGLESQETKALLPKTSLSSWAIGHPLEKISHYTREFDWVPPRCLIPRFPDDPKSRFRDELDEEAASSGAMRKLGSWKSVRTLELFWEMMAYRQECSSGRMTGFIWVVFNDGKEVHDDNTGPEHPATPKRSKVVNASPLTTPKKKTTTSQSRASENNAGGKGIEKDEKSRKARTKKEKGKRKKGKLKGPIKPRRAKVKTEQKSRLYDIPTSTPYYHWPQQGRGENIVDQTAYKRCVELLLHLDFGNLEKALSSTSRWIRDVGMGKDWGYTITGAVETPIAPEEHQADPGPNDLTETAKRKRDASQSGKGEVNVLSAGFVRKKAKPETNGREEAKVLDVGLVRKKPKVS